jgi:hypothetical protein
VEDDVAHLAGHQDLDAHRDHHQDRRRDHRDHQDHHRDADHRILQDGDPRRDEAHSHQFEDRRDAHLQGATLDLVPDREAAESDDRLPTLVGQEAAESGVHSVWSGALDGVLLPRSGQAAAWLDEAQNRVRGSK